MNGNERGSGRVNNVGDLLHHYKNRVADIEMAIALESLLAEIDRFSSSDTSYEIITSWRHPHSHGGERFPGPEHVVLLNIVSQLIWEIIPQQEYIEINDIRYTQKILEDHPFSELQYFDYYPLKQTKDLLIKRDWTPEPIL